MRRFFVSPLRTGALVLSGESAHHARVLRLRVGDEIELFDGRAAEAVGIIESIEPLTCRVESVESRQRGEPTVVLVQGLPKTSALDDVIRSTTEAGVSAIHLVQTTYSVPRAKAERVDSKMERWRRIAREAARQSERASVPPIVAPASFEEVMARAPAESTRLLLSPRAGARLHELESTRESWAFLGPEGGLSVEEEQRLLELGWQRVRLATPVMRVETAAPVVIAMLRDRLS